MQFRNNKSFYYKLLCKLSNFLPYIGTHQNTDALADLFMKQSGVIW